MSTAGVGGPELVEQMLSASMTLIRRELLRYIDGQGDDPLYAMAAEYPARPSKGLRPALCLAACRAHGGTTEAALGAAMAIEMLHNAFLVHDDICDGALRRRGADTLHVRHGIPQALNTGDAMVVIALGPLLEDARMLGPALTLAVLAEFRHLLKRTAEGQALELGWRDEEMARLSADDYLGVVLDKTCWYTTIHPCRVGALIGAGDRADLEGLARYGFFLGAVFQIHDDIENVTRCDSSFAKDYGGDIVEGKPTLLLMHLLRSLPAAESDAVMQLVGKAGARSGLERVERIDRVIALMERSGSIDYACAFADGLAGAALAEFDAAMGSLRETPDKAFLRSLPLYLRDPAVRGR